MRNLRVAVDNAADQTEARNIMISLGYLPKEITCISGGDLGFVVNAHNENGATYKEITLPELRDLVVLKRNDAGDATHYRNDGKEYFQTCDKERHYHFQDDAWVLSTWMNYQLLPQLKPIEKKEMKAKEYLSKETHFYAKTCDLVSKDSNWIEIPEGAYSFREDLKFYNEDGSKFYNSSNCWAKSTTDRFAILWQRPSHPEELPFIDDESSLGSSKIGRRAITVKFPVESLNDQYAEIEKVRQSAWQKQEGGSHYKNLKIQPMQYALENKLDYAQANVVKYVTRHKEKNGKEDLLKAIHNLELMIEFYYGDEK